MTDDVRIGAILLAAGRGTRFGARPKLVAPLEGLPLVRHAGLAIRRSRLRPAVAVIGAHTEAVRASLSGLDMRLVENPDHAAGLASSLKAGLAVMPEAVEAVVVVLGDMPRVTALQLDRLAEAYLSASPRPCAVVPVFEGRRGNPVLLNRRLLGPALAALDGDAGAGRLLAGRDDVLEIPGEAANALDVDTPEALASLLQRNA